MRPPTWHVLVLLGVLGIAIVAGGCSDDGGGDAPPTARLEVVVDFNIGDGRPALEAPSVARRLALEPTGDLLLADGYAVRRVDRRTGTIATVPGTVITTCADGSSAEGMCATGIAAVVADGAGRIYFALADNRIMRVGREGGDPEHVAGQPPERCPDHLPAAGPAREVCFAGITDLAFDPDGRLVIADGSGSHILRLDPASATVTVVAGTGRSGGHTHCPDDVPATGTCIGAPVGITVDPAGGIVIASLEHPVRRVDPDTGLISRVALRPTPCLDGEERGDGGPALDACHRATADVAVDGDGALYLADTFDYRYSTAASDYRIRRVDPSGVITTFDTSAADAGPVESLAVDDDGRLFALGYVGSYARHVRRYGSGPGSGTVIAGNGTPSVCGDGGPARDACIGFPNDVALGPDGSIYVSDVASFRVRRIVDGTITTIAGNGTLPRLPAERCAEDVPATETCIAGPESLAVDRAGTLYFVEHIPGPPEGNDRSRIRRVDARGVVRTVVGDCSVEADATSVPAVDACLGVTDVAIANDGTLHVAEFSRVLRLDAASGRLVPVVTSSADCDPFGGELRPECFHVEEITLDRAGNLYITDGTRVRRVAAGTTVPEIVAGNGTRDQCGDGGPATEACLFAVRIVADGASNLFVASAGSVRRIDAATGIITTVAGKSEGLCLGNDGTNVPPDLGCATVHAIDDAGRLVYPEVRQYFVGRVVRLDVPVGRPVP